MIEVKTAESETSWLFVKAEQTLSCILEQAHRSLLAKGCSYRAWYSILFYHVAPSEKSEYFIAKSQISRDTNHLLPVLETSALKCDISVQIRLNYQSLNNSSNTAGRMKQKCAQAGISSGKSDCILPSSFPATRPCFSGGNFSLSFWLAWQINHLAICT